MLTTDVMVTDLKDDTEPVVGDRLSPQERTAPAAQRTRRGPLAS